MISKLSLKIANDFFSFKYSMSNSWTLSSFLPHLSTTLSAFCSKAENTISTRRSKFDETQLPPIDCFYNTLNDEALSPQDYKRAQDIWSFFKIQNLQQYYDHYLLSDVLLLANVFEHFRQDVFEKHGFDCLFYPTLPSLAWSMAFKHTKMELNLITDEAIYLTFENFIRGGISTISNRYAKANNPLLDEYDLSSPSHI